MFWAGGEWMPFGFSIAFPSHLDEDAGWNRDVIATQIGDINANDQSLSEGVRNGEGERELE